MTDFDAVAFIRELEQTGPTEDARTGLDTESLVAADPTLSGVVVTDALVAGPHGDVPVRVYVDRAIPPTIGLVWVHGGAFIGGTIDMPEAHWVSLYMASRGIAVVSVEYRKALHGVHYPVPLDDVVAAWLWVAGDARPLGATIDRLHLGGASAGATLAAGATARLRDEGLPVPASLILAYPLLHRELPELGQDLLAALATNPPPINFTPAVVEAFNANYLGPAAGEARYAFLGDTAIRNLPPVLIVNAEADELRASGERFARQLAEGGLEVTCTTQAGSQHGFLDQPGDASAVAAMTGFLAHMHRLR